jgi:hypothetical protein
VVVGIESVRDQQIRIDGRISTAGALLVQTFPGDRIVIVDESMEHVAVVAGEDDLLVLIGEPVEVGGDGTVEIGSVVIEFLLAAHALLNILIIWKGDGVVNEIITGFLLLLEWNQMSRKSVWKLIFLRRYKNKKNEATLCQATQDC